MVVDCVTVRMVTSRLLESLESLSDQENDRVWAEEAQARAQALDRGTLDARPADYVFREARSRT